MKNWFNIWKYYFIFTLKNNLKKLYKSILNCYRLQLNFEEEQFLESHMTALFWIDVLRCRRLLHTVSHINQSKVTIFRIVFESIMKPLKRYSNKCINLNQIYLIKLSMYKNLWYLISIHSNIVLINVCEVWVLTFIALYSYHINTK